jgi:hypothetical protein
MKKQELIHLHGLLAEVRKHHEARTGVSAEYESYQSLGVRPTSIHQSKTDHKDAVFALADGITTDMRRTETETVPAAAD